MRIKENSLINEIQHNNYVAFHCEYIMKALMSDDERKQVYLNKMNLCNEKNYRKMIFSKKSVQNLDNYIVPKDIRVDVLKSLPNRKDIIQLDESTCIQYIKTDELLSVIFHYTKQDVLNPWGQKAILMNYFEVNLEDGNVTSDYNLCGTNEVLDRNSLIEKFYSKFLVVLTYLELTDVTYDILLGGMSFGTNKQGKIKNDTRNKYILVNTNWNTTIIRIDEFSVKGHYRLQPYGVGRKQYKYIFIEPYTKGGIKRLAQKNLVGPKVS